MNTTDLDVNFEKLIELQDQAQKKNISKKRFDLLQSIITTVQNAPHKHLLIKIINQAQLLKDEGYSTESHIGLIIYLESLKTYTDGMLISKLVKRVQSHLKREARFFKLKNPDNDFYHDICDTALVSIMNLIPIIQKPSEDELNINVLLNEIIKYRQNTLSDQEAWDHVAQQILQATNKAPS